MSMSENVPSLVMTSTVSSVNDVSEKTGDTMVVDGEKSLHRLGTLDTIVVLIYFLLMLATGFWSMFRTKNRGTVSGYFLAGRYLSWFPVGASVFASNIGSEHFMGLAGSGAATGLGVGAFELNALLILQLTGWIFLPVFIASRVCTLPEFMSRRFGGKRIQTMMALLSLMLYVFTKISVNLFSGAIFIQQAVGWNLYSSVICLLITTAICTVTGGLAAVIYTETLQCFIMIVGTAILAVKAFCEVGSWSELETRYMESRPSIVPANYTHCAEPSKDAFRMLRGLDDSSIPWLGFIFGQTFASLWYWCTDQVIVQRLLAAKSLSHAQGGTLFAGYMKILPLFLIIIPGMISRILYTDEIACVDPNECWKYCQNRLGCSNTAYPRLVLELLPNGLKGLMMAGMLAALMSGLASIFNSASTMFTIDIWPQIRKKASVRELMIVGRAFVVVMVFVSIAWIPVINEMQGGQIFIYIQAVSAYLSPPIAAVYAMAVLWKRMNESGAFWALVIGLVAGTFRMILDLIYREPACGEDDLRPFLIRKIHYMYFAIILVTLSSLSAIIISLLTEPLDKYRIVRTTYWTRYDTSDRDDDKENWELKVDIVTTDKIDTEANDQDEAMKASKVKQFVSWFCGMDATNNNDTEQTMTCDFEGTHVSLLSQTTREKWILRIFLFIVVLTAIGLFTYFSV